MFSSRVPPDLRPNALARARAAAGELPFDLTAANPTTCGFPYPPDLLAPLSSAEALAYRPHPLGATVARYEVRYSAGAPL